MRTVNNNESTGRQANPWLTLLLVVATVIVACFLPGWWLPRNALLLEAVGASVGIAVSAIYTAIYGGVRLVFQDRGWMTVLMLASPWLVAVVNVWGRVMPSVLTTTAAFTGLLAALSIGVTEELLFRGMLFRGFQARSMALYVLVNSIIFGLVHYQQGYEGVMVTAVVGSSYSLARVAGSPLSLLIVCHAVTDFPTLFSHTPHPQYRLVAFGVLVVVLAITLSFLSRRTNWTNQDGEVPPST
jgi:membrane protease YdiL (CAAX protease family)